MSHLFRILGAPLADPLRYFQSTKFQFYLLKVPNLCHWARIGGPRMVSLGCSFGSVENFVPLVRIYFSERGYRGELMMIRHIYPWVQLIWGLLIFILDTFPTVVFPLSSGPWSLYWFPLAWCHFHCIGLLRCF